MDERKRSGLGNRSGIGSGERLLFGLLALIALAGASACVEPKIKTLLPADGSVQAGDSVALSGTFEGVAAANAVVTVNGQPATVAGSNGFSYTATGLTPGLNAFVVTLTDTTKPEVRARRRTVVVRGPSVAAGAYVDDALSVRFNESFFDSLPVAKITEAALANFVAENEYFQSGLGAELVAALIDAAGTLNVEITEANKLEITLSPDVSVDGQHTFDLPGPIPGSVTCRMVVSVGGTFGVQGDLEPAAGDPATLDFDGGPIGAIDLGMDIDDPDIGACDAPGLELPGELLWALMDEFANDALVELAERMASAIRLDPELHACADEPCPPGSTIDVAIDGRFDAADERDDGLVADVSGRIRPLTTTGSAVFDVAATLPSLGLTTPATGRAYDLGLALSPTTVNELLAAVVAEGALDRDVTDAMPAELVTALQGQFPNLTARLDANAAPYLDGTTVCPDGVAAPRLLAPNLELRLESAATAGATPKPFLVIAFDLVAGLRLRPVTTPPNRLALGADFVLGAACADTTMTATVLLNKTGFTDDLVQLYLGAGLRDPIGAAVSDALTPLPLDALFSLEDANGDPLAEIGLQPVELSDAGGVYQVFVNLLVDGEGGDPNAVALEELFFSTEDKGSLVGLERLGGQLYLGFGFGTWEIGSASIYKLDPSAAVPTLELVADQVFGPAGWMRGITTDGVDLYAIGGTGEFSADAREIRRITPAGVVSVVTTWPWDNQFASSIYAESGSVYFQRAWNPDVIAWNDTQGRSIWRVGTDGSNVERHVGPQHQYLEITADIDRLPGGDLIGLGPWFGEGELWTYLERYPGGAVETAAYMDDFHGRELAVPCDDEVLAVGEGEAAHTGEIRLWSEATGAEALSIAYPVAPPIFEGAATSAGWVYLAAGAPSSGVQVYRMPWSCD